MDYEILIRNGTIMPLADGAGTLIRPGFVGIRDGIIRDVGAMAELPETASGRRIIEAEGRLVMPGLINAHNHAPMTLFRGLADDLSLLEWLQEHIFPAEARFVNPDMAYWCAKLAAAEMILAGTTTVADSYFYEGEAAAAFAEAGMRAVAAQGIIDFPAPGVPDPAENIAYAGRFLKRLRGKYDLVIPAVFCHSPYTCSAATLRKAKDLAREHGALFFIHVAETREEAARVPDGHDASPVVFLQETGILDQDTVCVHCVWLNEVDIGLIARSGAKVVVCPESNMKLGSGVAPLPEIIAAGIPVGLGTDGCASNNNLDLFQEMDVCAKLHKVNRLDPAVLPARRVLRMATRDGARVLGMEGLAGGLCPGMRADVILLDLESPHLTPFYSADMLVYAASGADVSTVIIDGRLVMLDRRILSFDVRETIARVRELAREVAG